MENVFYNALGKTRVRPILKPAPARIFSLRYLNYELDEICGDNTFKFYFIFDTKHNIFQTLPLSVTRNSTSKWQAGLWCWREMFMINDMKRMIVYLSFSCYGYFR